MCLGLSHKQADSHLAKTIEKAGDPDCQVATWLREGFPVGIKLPITPGGLLPLITEHTDLTPADLEVARRLCPSWGCGLEAPASFGADFLVTARHLMA